LAETIQDTMNSDDEPTRRDVILVAAAGFAAVGAAAALWPLLDQMNPDQSALSLATTDVDLSHIDVGQAITVMWRGKPIFIRRRADDEIAAAKSVPVDDLPDPYARNANLPDDAPASDENRAGKDREPWLVMIGICTHLGCIPIAASSAVGSVRAMVRNTTRRVASGSDRRRRTWRSHLTISSPTPRSRSAKRLNHGA